MQIHKRRRHRHKLYNNRSSVNGHRQGVELGEEEEERNGEDMDISDTDGFCSENPMFSIATADHPGSADSLPRSAFPVADVVSCCGHRVYSAGGCV
eukprot:13334-Eustigmatos_ZCMA.PRE.1